MRELTEGSDVQIALLGSSDRFWSPWAGTMPVLGRLARGESQLGKGAGWDGVVSVGPQDAGLYGILLACDCRYGKGMTWDEGCGIGEA